MNISFGEGATDTLETVLNAIIGYNVTVQWFDDGDWVRDAQFQGYDFEGRGGMMTLYFQEIDEPGDHVDERPQLALPVDQIEFLEIY